MTAVVNARVTERSAQVGSARGRVGQRAVQRGGDAGRPGSQVGGNALAANRRMASHATVDASTLVPCSRAQDSGQSNLLFGRRVKDRHLQGLVDFLRPVLESKHTWSVNRNTVDRDSQYLEALAVEVYLHGKLR